MQKTVLALTDLAGLGRAALYPVQCAVAAAGHQCIPLPAAVYSSHMGLPGWKTQDGAALIEQALGQYAALGLYFDAVYTGFLTEPAQFAAARTALLRKKQNGIALVDPILGDNGRPYAPCDGRVIAAQQSLCAQADLITPNPTEAALLLGIPYTAVETRTQAEGLLAALHGRFGGKVVLTGLMLSAGAIAVACYDGDSAHFYQARRSEGGFPGAGDLYAAVLLSYLLHGRALPDAMALAADFVSAAALHTAEQGGEALLGLQFEPLLHRLAPQM